MWDDEDKKAKPAYRQQIVEHVKKSVTHTVFDTKWVPLSSRLVTCGNYPRNTGCLCVYQLKSGELEKVQEVEKYVAHTAPHAAHPHTHHRSVPFKCMTFNHCPPETRTLATGNFQGALQVWDLERPDTAVYDNPNAHTVWGHPPALFPLSFPPPPSYTRPHSLPQTIINGVDGACFTGPPELVTGSREGSVKVWDIRQRDKPVAALSPARPEAARDCWSVAFGNSYNATERLIAAGYDNGDVKLFDLRMMKMRYEFNTTNGVCHLAFDRPDIEANKLIVSSLEGRIRIYNLRTLHPTLGYAYVEQRVGAGTIWSTKPLPQNREVFMTCGAGELALCKYQNPPQQSIKDAEGREKGVAGSVDEVNKVCTRRRL